MGFIKVTKNRAYFKRFQVKYRRRREGKTDYHARRAMIIQDKDKYNVPKYRLVVRFTNKKIICQVIYATLTGDRVLCAADSSELKNYGIETGLTNYAASYATGLLMGRRLLTQLGISETFTGVETVTGEYEEEDDDERRPFKCILDVGLVRTTTGNRVFGAMKGACDAGLYIPHNVKRFPGYSRKDDSYDASVHRARIFGNHVAEYMKTMKEENPDKYEAHFSHYIKQGITAETVEELYSNAHAKIRENPVHEKKARSVAAVCVREGTKIKTSTATYPRPKRFTCDERKARVALKIQKIAEARMAVDDEE